jgi:hypothetical protein
MRQPRLVARAFGPSLQTLALDDQEASEARAGRRSLALAKEECAAGARNDRGGVPHLSASPSERARSVASAQDPTVSHDETAEVRALGSPATAAATS